MYQCQFFLAAFVEAATNLGPVVRPIMPAATPNMKPIIFCPTTGPIGTGMKLQAIDLSYKYPNASRYAVRNLNFTVEAGETIAIVGENGAGKTTLLHALTRLVDYVRLRVSSRPS
jgi:ABC-type transport system involved in cytochrome bd biosynthesis fused ATPase/permease subunit